MNKADYYHQKLVALNQPERIFERPALPTDPVSFHIVGICGTAMGSLAGLLREKGYTVSGSDQGCYPPISDMLETLDVDVHTGNYEASNIGEADVVVIGNVSTPHNPEATYARENKLPQAVLPEVLREYVFGDAQRIVVAGTHGKTTTTGIVAALFEAGGKDPGYMIGGVPQPFDSAQGKGKDRSFALGKGEYAIFEGDEYDTSYFNKMPKFLQYGAHTGIVTSLELDHLDIYSDLEDYTKAFHFFAQDIPEDGYLFIHGDDPALVPLKAEVSCTVRTYGFDDGNDIYAKYARVTEHGTQLFTVVIDGEELGEVETPLPGLYNILNCLGAIGIAHAHHVDFESIKKGLLTFKGMKRRQEVVAEIGEITIIDDFAHHPTSVKATLAGIKAKYEGRRIVALFEPRSNSSRKKIFEQDYMKSFESADVVCLKTPPLRHNDTPEDFIDPHAVVIGIKEHGTDEAHAFEDVESMLDAIVPKLAEGDVVMMMSNGNFDGLKEKLVERVKSR